MGNLLKAFTQQNFGNLQLTKISSHKMFILYKVATIFFCSVFCYKWLMICNAIVVVLLLVTNSAGIW